MNNILNFLRNAFAHASLYGEGNGEQGAPKNRAQRRNKKFDRVTGR